MVDWTDKAKVSEWASGAIREAFLRGGTNLMQAEHFEKIGGRAKQKGHKEFMQWIQATATQLVDAGSRDEQALAHLLAASSVVLRMLSAQGDAAVGDHGREIATRGTVGIVMGTAQHIGGTIAGLGENKMFGGGPTWTVLWAGCFIKLEREANEMAKLLSQIACKCGKDHSQDNLQSVHGTINWVEEVLCYATLLAKEGDSIAKLPRSNVVGRAWLCDDILTPDQMRKIPAICEALLAVPIEASTTMERLLS